MGPNQRILPAIPDWPSIKLDNRTALNAILWLMRSGAPWRDLPERYGSWKTVYSRFRAWVSSGLFEQVFLELIDDPDMENLSLDSTIVRAHQKATGAKKTPNIWSKIKLLD